MACIQEGLLVFAPNRDVSGENPPTMHAYVVTVEEILRLRLVARLVVLSCGFGPHERDFVDDGHLLANSFLVAGAQCVVSMLWAVPNKALDKFYYNFYSCLQKGNYVTTAVTYATTCLRKDDRYVCCSIFAVIELVLPNIASFPHALQVCGDRLLDACEANQPGSISLAA